MPGWTPEDAPDPARQLFETARAEMVAGDLAGVGRPTRLSPFPCASDGGTDTRCLTQTISPADLTILLIDLPLAPGAG